MHLRKSALVLLTLAIFETTPLAADEAEEMAARPGVYFDKTREANRAMPSAGTSSQDSYSERIQNCINKMTRLPTDMGASEAAALCLKLETPSQEVDDQNPMSIEQKRKLLRDQSDKLEDQIKQLKIDIYNLDLKKARDPEIHLEAASDYKSQAWKCLGIGGGISGISTLLALANEYWAAAALSGVLLAFFVAMAIYSFIKAGDLEGLTEKVKRENDQIDAQIRPKVDRKNQLEDQLNRVKSEIKATGAPW